MVAPKRSSFDQKRNGCSAQFFNSITEVIITTALPNRLVKMEQTVWFLENGEGIVVI